MLLQLLRATGRSLHRGIVERAEGDDSQGGSLQGELFELNALSGFTNALTIHAQTLLAADRACTNILSLSHMWAFE